MFMALSPAWPANVWQLAFLDWLRGRFFLQTGPLSLSEAKVMQEHRTPSPPPPTVLASMARKAASPALCAGLPVYTMLTEGLSGPLCRGAGFFTPEFDRLLLYRWAFQGPWTVCTFGGFYPGDGGTSGAFPPKATRASLAGTAYGRHTASSGDDLPPAAQRPHDPAWRVAPIEGGHAPIALPSASARTPLGVPSFWTGTTSPC